MKRYITGINRAACGDTSPLRFACGEASARLSSYTTPLVLSVLLHVAQIVFVVSMSIAIITVTPMLWFMWIIFDPQTAAIPAVLTAGAAGLLVLVITIVYMIAYHVYFFSKIGAFVAIPVLAGFATVAFSFIPIAGPVIAIIASVVPWMTVAILYHQRCYRTGGMS